MPARPRSRRSIATSRHATRIASVAALSTAILSAAATAQQPTGPGLVVDVPPAEAVTVVTDSFPAPDGTRKALFVYRARDAQGAQPLVLFVSPSPAGPTMRGYVEWARLATTRGLTAILYEGSTFDRARSQPENLAASLATLDSVAAHVARRGASSGIDPSRLVVWAGSAPTFTGTPFALGGERPGVKGYVLYYGYGAVAEPRLDVPVFMVRAGLDSPGLNAGLDSLARQLVEAAVPVTLVNHPAGSHGFDIFDRTATSASVIRQTLDFIADVTKPEVHAAIVAGAPMARASRAMARQRWAEAESLYAAIARERPQDREVHWHLGRAQLANAHPAEALASFDRARSLGKGGAGDIGMPAMRAAVRAGNTAKAVEWTQWALRSYAPIRGAIAGDTELAPLLEHPEVRGR